MGKLLSTLLIFSVCFALAAPSSAGLAHPGTLVCADCHIMHRNTETSSQGSAPVGVLGGQIGELLQQSPNEVCLTCHDGSTSAPDVLGVSQAGYVRQTGGLSRIGGPEPGYPEWTGHTLGSVSVAPGGTWSNPRGLSCVDCHDPHGIRTQFRNLRTSDDPTDIFYNKALTFASGSLNDLTKDVFLHGGSDAAHKYGVEGTDFNEPNPTRSAYAQWCDSCHTVIHGSTMPVNVSGASLGNSGSVVWTRHPSADVNVGRDPRTSSLAKYQSCTNRVKTMSTSGNWATGADVTPSCFSCHKAHGNKNPFGLIYMSGSGAVTEEGDTGGSYVNDLCLQCHFQ